MTKSARFFLAAAVVTSICYLCLVQSLPISANAEAGYDDALFVFLAKKILSGHWLGDYNQFTLIKGPMYPVFLSLAWIIGMPVILAQAILFLLGGVLIAYFLEFFLRKIPHIKTPIRYFLVFVFYKIFLWDPILYSEANLRIAREGLYVPLLILIVACLMGWLKNNELHEVRYSFNNLFWPLCLGWVVAVFWLTREEGVWIVPGLLVFFLLNFLSQKSFQTSSKTGFKTSSKKAREQTVVLAGIAAAIPVFLCQGVALLNYWNYGTYDGVEFKQKEFLSAYGSLTRILPKNKTPISYVPVTQDVLEEAGKFSPALLRLLPFLKKSVFIGHGCKTYRIEPCDGEIRGAWFMWALRDAVSTLGGYESALTSQRYYQLLANELGAACESHQLECLSRRVTLLPPFRSEYIYSSIRDFSIEVKVVVFHLLSSFSAGESVGSPHQLKNFVEVVNSYPSLPSSEVVVEGVLDEPSSEILVRQKSQSLERTWYSIYTAPTPEGKTRFELTTRCLKSDCEMIVRRGDHHEQVIAIRKILNSKSQRFEGGEIVHWVLSDENIYSPRLRKGRIGLWIFGKVNLIYQVFSPLLFFLGMVGFLGAMLLDRRLTPLLILSTTTLVFLGSRLALIAYLNATSMSGISTLYLAPCYPLVLLFGGFSLLDVVIKLKTIFGLKKK